MTNISQKLLPVSMLRQIDRLADQFEDACRQGRRPLIEDCLSQIDPDFRFEALCELLQIEWELQYVRTGMAPDSEQYAARFPEAITFLSAWENERATGAVVADQPLGNRVTDGRAIWEKLCQVGLVAGPLPEGSPVDGSGCQVRSLLEALISSGRITRLQARIASGEIDLPLECGPYLIIDELGSGGMGRVFRARHRLMDRDVAIKFLTTARELDEQSREQFLAEIRTVSQLDHPGIVTPLHADVEGARTYLVMELVAGVNLQQFVMEHGPLNDIDAVLVARSVAEAVAHAHGQGVLHRDLKPSNIMFLPNGKTKVLDLGLAQISGRPEVTAQIGDPASYYFAGTPEFAAPEQAWAPDRIDQRTDVYSLGCTLFFLLYGKAPFRFPSAYLTMIAHRFAPRPDLLAIRTDVDPMTAKAVVAMISNDPATRPQSMTAVVERLDQRLKLGKRYSSPQYSEVPPVRWSGQLFARNAAITILSLLGFAIVVAICLLTLPKPGRMSSISDAWSSNGVFFLPTNVDGLTGSASILKDSEEKSKVRAQLYVWSETSTVYHDENCWAVDRILDSNRRQGTIPPPGKSKHNCRPKR